MDPFLLHHRALTAVAKGCWIKDATAVPYTILYYAEGCTAARNQLRWYTDLSTVVWFMKRSPTAGASQCQTHWLHYFGPPIPLRFLCNNYLHSQLATAK